MALLSPKSASVAKVRLRAAAHFWAAVCTLAIITDRRHSTGAVVFAQGGPSELKSAQHRLADRSDAIRLPFSVVLTYFQSVARIPFRFDA
jgi:hypothetical protein